MSGKIPKGKPMPMPRSRGPSRVTTPKASRSSPYTKPLRPPSKHTVAVVPISAVGSSTTSAPTPLVETTIANSPARTPLQQLGTNQREMPPTKPNDDSYTPQADLLFRDDFDESQAIRGDMLDYSYNHQWKDPNEPSSSSNSDHRFIDLGSNVDSTGAEPSRISLNRCYPIVEQPMDKGLVPKYTATVQGKWSLPGIAATQMYDMKNGIPFDRATCEENVKKLLKNDREIDWFEWITSAQECHNSGNFYLERISLRLASSTMLLNEQQKKLSKKVQIEKAMFVNPQAQLFSLEAAVKADDVVELPNRKWFMLSKAIDPEKVSRWTADTFKVNAQSLCTHVYDQLELVDPYMGCYGISENATIYIPIAQQFFQRFREFAVAGFSMLDKETVRNYVESLLRDMMKNKLDRVRRVYKLTHGEDSIRVKTRWMKEELAKEHSDIFFPDELIFVESPEGSADLENMGDLTEKTGGEGTSGAPASS